MIKSYKRFLLWGAFAIFVCLLVAAIFSGATAVTRTAVADDDPPDSAFMDTPIVDPAQEAADLATKIATMNQLEADQAAAAAQWAASNQTKTNSGDPSFDSEAAPAFPTGIFNDDVVSLDPGWTQYYSIKNRWQGVIRSTEYVVYAESKHDSPLSDVYDTTPLQGVLVKVTISADTSLAPPQTEFLTATRTGPLTITSVTGSCLSLTSSADTSYQFDVATNDWSCSADSP